jgi:hypothetical protein
MAVSDAWNITDAGGNVKRLMREGRMEESLGNGNGRTSAISMRRIWPSGCTRENRPSQLQLLRCQHNMTTKDGNKVQGLCRCGRLT